MLDGIIICDDKGKVIYAKQSLNSPLKLKTQSNVEWAVSIIKYAFTPHHQPPQEATFRAVLFKDRLIVYNVVDKIFYIAIGSFELGELALSDVVSKMYGIIYSITKKSPDDAELILKNYPKLTLLFDNLVIEGGYGTGSVPFEETKISKKVII